MPIYESQKAIEFCDAANGKRSHFSSRTQTQGRIAVQISLLVLHRVHLVVSRPVIVDELHAEVSIQNHSVHFAFLLLR